MAIAEKLGIIKPTTGKWREPLRQRCLVWIRLIEIGGENDHIMAWATPKAIVTTATQAIATNAEALSVSCPASLGGGRGNNRGRNRLAGGDQQPSERLAPPAPSQHSRAMRRPYGWLLRLPTEDGAWPQA
jgi:hypothetical protein